MARRTLKERLEARGTGTDARRAQRDIEGAIDALLRTQMHLRRGEQKQAAMAFRTAYAIASQLHVGPTLQLDLYGEG